MKLLPTETTGIMVAQAVAVQEVAELVAAQAVVVMEDMEDIIQLLAFASVSIFN
jgi:hypothetical protein